MKILSFLIFVSFIGCTGDGGGGSSSSGALSNSGQSTDPTEVAQEALKAEVDSLKAKLTTTDHHFSLGELEALEQEGLLSADELKELQELSLNNQ